MRIKKISKGRDRISLRKYHSIPILLGGDRCKLSTNKHLRYVSYSIPLMCGLALLFMVGSLVVVNSNDEVAYAEGNEGIDLQSASSGLSITQPNLSAIVAPGETGYVSSNVTYSASDITSYTLQVTYASGKTGLTNGSKTLVGAGGKTPANMANDSWGFSWGSTSTANSSMTYYTMPNYNTKGTSINNGRLEYGTSDIGSTTKKIVFAAKFASNNTTTGNYRTQALLSLVATPKATYTLTYNANNGSGAPSSQSCTTTASSPTSCNITTSSTEPTRNGYTFKGWANSSTATKADYSTSQSIPMTVSKTVYAVWAFGGITNMQQMTSSICSAADIGDTALLTDTRDTTTSYTVAKLSDNKCWMTQNLRLVNYTTTTSDSQTGGITIPNAASNFTGSNNEAAYYSGNETYGAYYSWYTATAHTGTASVSSGDVKGSICPKGWRLPTQAEYTALKNKGTAKVGTWSANSTTSGYWVGASTASAAGSAFFPAAGNYNGTSLNRVGTYGRYWSSTAYSSSNAYLLYFSSSDTPYLGSGTKYYGFPVRCVASS